MALWRIRLTRVVAALLVASSFWPDGATAQPTPASQPAVHQTVSTRISEAAGDPVAAPATALAPGDERWDSRFGPPGVDGDVYAVLNLGTSLVAGGSFENAGKQRASRIARYHQHDGRWSALGFGLNGTVRALAATSSGDVIAGGDFTGACLDLDCGTTVPLNRMARFTAGQWTPIGSGLSGSVYSVLVSGTVLYAGGDFTRACDDIACSGGTTVNNVARVNLVGGTWQPVSFGLSGIVLTLARSPSGVIHAGGLFVRACADAACGPIGPQLNFLTALSGGLWQPVRFGVNGPVTALDFESSGRLNVGGAFTGPCRQLTCDSIEFTRSNFLRFLGGQWQTTSPGFDKPVNAIQVVGSDVFVGGAFTSASDGTPILRQVSFVARISGDTVSPLGGGLDGLVMALAPSANGVIAGGRFSGSLPATGQTIGAPRGLSRIARFEAEWEPLTSGEGANDDVLAIAVNGTEVYVGGRFSVIGGQPANRIARWSRLTGQWSILGAGLAGPVHAIAVAPNGDVYAGGEFAGACQTVQCAQTIAAPNIARFSAGAWQPLAGGTNGPIYALAMTGTTLYVGGAFTTAGIPGAVVNVNRIARYAGGAWSPLGTGLDNDVLAIRPFGGRVVTGGRFVQSLAHGSNSAVILNHVGTFNGTVWSGLGQGTNGTVSAIDVDLSGVVTVGGNFTSATDGLGTRIARSIASFDGTLWSPVDNGFDGEVLALARNGPNLYAGGLFQRSCTGVPASCLAETAVSRIASLQGGQWTPLASGIRLGTVPGSPSVRAIGVVGPDVFVGGDFRLAGEQPSWHFGRYGELADLVVSQSVAPNPVAVGNPVTFTIVATNTGKSNALGVTLTLAIPAGSRLITLSATGGACIVVPDPRCDAPNVSEGGTVIARLVISSSTAGNLVNVVSVQSAIVDPTPANNVSRLGTIVQPAPVSSFGERVPAVNGVVYALSRRPPGGRPTVAGLTLASETTVYAGGAFTTAGGMTVNFVAQLDPLTLGWNALGGGLNGPVLTLASSGSTLFAGGGFSQAGGALASFVAQYDPVNGWNAMAGGMNGQVQSLATLGTGVVAGGQFSQAGGQAANFVAQYDPVTGWTALGTGTNGPVMAVAVAGSTIVVGGAFSQAGTASTANIALWNGSSWQAPIGGGTNGPVETLAVSGNELYVGGSFSLAGGQPANNIAKYDLTTGVWSALGGGTNGTVETTSTSGSDLFVGGAFTQAGEQPVGYLAKWDGVDWAPVGDGTNATVFALVTNGPSQYIGGAFTEAGGLPVGYVARFGPPRTIYPRQTLVAIGVNRRLD